MQIVRNVKTGLEFPATTDLVKFAKNPRNNLEVIEVEDGEVIEVDIDPVTSSEPPVDPVANVPAPDVPTVQLLPLQDSPDDGFASPPPLPKKK